MISIEGGLAPLAGVIVTLCGAAEAETTMDSSGHYCFRHLEEGDYIVRPWMEGYFFTPGERRFEMEKYSYATADFLCESGEACD